MKRGVLLILFVFILIIIPYAISYTCEKIGIKICDKTFYCANDQDIDKIEKIMGEDWCGCPVLPVPGVCTPTCPLPSEVCSGTTDTRDDGCKGNCNVVGTKDCVVCGNNRCESGENCNNCPRDCGECQEPTDIVWKRSISSCTSIGCKPFNDRNCVECRKEFGSDKPCDTDPFGPAYYSWGSGKCISGSADASRQWSDWYKGCDCSKEPVCDPNQGKPCGICDSGTINCAGECIGAACDYSPKCSPLTATCGTCGTKTRTTNCCGGCSVWTACNDPYTPCIYLNVCDSGRGTDGCGNNCIRSINPNCCINSNSCSTNEVCENNICQPPSKTGSSTCCYTYSECQAQAQKNKNNPLAWPQNQDCVPHGITERSECY